MEKESVRAVTCSTKEAKITFMGIPDVPGTASQLFMALAESNVVVDTIIQNSSEEGKTDISFTLPQSDLEKGLEICQGVGEILGADRLSGSKDMAKVSIIGLGMRSHTGVASTMFAALAREGINIEMISTSEIKISCVIKRKYAELAVRVLHDVFELEKPL